MRTPQLLVIIVLVTACTGGPILANAPVQRASPLPATPAPHAIVDPQPLAFPRDDGPHHRLTEWWYYTGHLVTDSGRRFGFEDVIFRAERGALPVSWASHLALTDEQGQRFLYGQRAEIGSQVDSSPLDTAGLPAGFALAVSGQAASGPPPAAAPWSLRGSGGRDHLAAGLTAADAVAAGQATAFGLDLDLATNLPPVLHDRVGYIDFGEAGGSYYYSRPRMTAVGTVQLGGETLHVTGEAWFDHQWGDFISVGGAGWDWFAVNLADGTNLTLSLVRDASGAHPLVYGTLVQPDGTFQHLDASAFSVDVLGTWTSPATRTVYPAKWRLRVPAAGLDITLEPTVPGQELDTRPTTGVVYWEGSERVQARKYGQSVSGEAYVELTGDAT